MKLTDNAIDLILKYEIGGSRKYYERFLDNPSWPEGASGVTIGIGYDLGYEQHFKEDWLSKLPSGDFYRLSRTLGLKGSRAKAAISGVRDIIIPWEAALEVFDNRTLPQQIAETLEAFPNAESLPPDAFGALVSIVFNRGPFIDGSDRRKEMKAIRDILQLGGDDVVDEDDVLAIADQVESMARLWKDNPRSDGDLHDRRLEEAALIRASIS